MFPATVTDAANATRSSYLPYGATRGDGDLTIDHGWLNQVSDESDTGLIYLNARYYDPVLSRFISPDPLMNPSDPRTLDPYRYADNNPVLFSDAGGLAASCGGLSGAASEACLRWLNPLYDARTGETITNHNEKAALDNNSSGGHRTGPGYGIRFEFVDGIEQLPENPGSLCPSGAPFCPSAVLEYGLALMEKHPENYIDANDPTWNPYWESEMGFPDSIPPANGAENWFWTCPSELSADCANGNWWRKMDPERKQRTFKGHALITGANNWMAGQSGDVTQGETINMNDGPRSSFYGVGPDGNILTPPPGFGNGWGVDEPHPETGMFCRSGGTILLPSSPEGAGKQGTVCVAG
jgi:RHS repeat-associated protein